MNLSLLILLLGLMYVFKKDKEILNEDFKALHPLYSIIFISDCINPREIRLLLFVQTITQQAFFEALLFSSENVIALGDKAIILIGILGILISSCLNYVTGTVHFFSVFKETTYLRKWIGFYVFVGIQLGKLK